jgi:hypothetical protein
MTEQEFREAMGKVAATYPVDKIDPIEGSGTWTDKQVIRLESRVGGVWNPLAARQYYLDAKRAIEGWVKNHPDFSV